MSRMQSPPSQKKVVKGRVDAELKEQFAEACKSAGVAQKEVVVAAVEEFVEEHGLGEGVSPEDDGYYPADDTLRELYEVCWEHADEQLKIYKHLHASVIAEDAGSFESQNLSSALVALRRKGFVALGAMPVNLTGDGYERRKHWHVKPPCADPVEWKYSEVDA